MNIVRTITTAERYFLPRYATDDERAALIKAGFNLRNGQWVRWNTEFQELSSDDLLARMV